MSFFSSFLGQKNLSMSKTEDKFWLINTYLFLDFWFTIDLIHTIHVHAGNVLLLPVKSGYSSLVHDVSIPVHNVNGQENGNRVVTLGYMFLHCFLHGKKKTQTVNRNDCKKTKKNKKCQASITWFTVTCQVGL